MQRVTAQQIRELAIAQGFALCGVAPALPSAHEQSLRQWLSAGKHGEMDYLKRNVDVRLDPRQLLPGAASVICVADRHPTQSDTPEEQAEGPFGRVARYAWCDDYHKTIKKRLHTMADVLRSQWPEHEYRATVDTAPLLEREHAARAGLGWVGKNTLLLHPQLGSYLMLGAIVTTLPIAPDTTPGAEADHCGTCTRCIDACPTDCITPYSVDASRCISYLTIEHRSMIAEEFHEPIGNWLAGCDICQEVCPYNAPRLKPGDSVPRASKQTTFPLLDVLDWDASARQSALTGSALKRLSLPMWKRNALIAAGNYLREHEDPALRHRIDEIANDSAEPDIVRQTAAQIRGSIARKLDDPDHR